MFDINEFPNTPIWDLENKIFYQYCNWCFANDQDNNDDDCDECQQKFYADIKRRKEK
ncbi:MAG: hypothetical protein KBT27_09170 [Prevotellaceae bacterium]|nr:hypothetical protein [Candidatus Faecinaster equi]